MAGRTPALAGTTHARYAQGRTGGTSFLRGGLLKLLAAVAQEHQREACQVPRLAPSRMPACFIGRTGLEIVLFAAT